MDGAAVEFFHHLRISVAVLCEEWSSEQDICRCTLDDIREYGGLRVLHLNFHFNGFVDVMKSFENTDGLVRWFANTNHLLCRLLVHHVDGCTGIQHCIKGVVTVLAINVNDAIRIVSDSIHLCDRGILWFSVRFLMPLEVLAVIKRTLTCLVSCVSAPHAFIQTRGLPIVLRLSSPISVAF